MSIIIVINIMLIIVINTMSIIVINIMFIIVINIMFIMFTIAMVYLMEERFSAIDEEVVGKVRLRLLSIIMVR